MAVQIFINVRPYQTRVACVERGRLKHIFYHRSKSPSLVGALYKGRVVKIVRTLNHAFVDLGLERSGFLYGKDLLGPNKEVSSLLKPGKEILVQIKADPIRSKGVRLSMEIGLAGLYVVYLPGQRAKTTLSRQIISLKERERLENIVKKFKERGALIVRTFAQKQPAKAIEKDLSQLKGQWKEIQKRFQKQKELGQIYKGEDSLLAFLRDALSFNVQRFVVDEKETFKKVTNWLKTFRPDLAEKTELDKMSKGLFSRFGLEDQAQKSRQKKLPLRSGGFLIFEELEAFSVIDVNSGRFSGTGRNLSKSFLRLNLEAAKQIAEQVQLRNLGGIILIDFIDMEYPEDGEKVISCLERGFRGDKSHTRVFPMGELGLAQITRKRSANSLSHFMTEVCLSCQGAGRKKTLLSLVADLFLKIEKMAPPVRRLIGKKQKIRITCHPQIKTYVQKEEEETLKFFNKQLSLSLLWKEDPQLPLENFRIEKL